MQVTVTDLMADKSLSCDERLEHTPLKYLTPGYFCVSGDHESADVRMLP